jgi:hypothetical protein
VQAKDLSDLHKELGREKLLPAIQASVVEVQTEDRQKSESKRPPLTIRTIDEILAMQFDPADLILPNGYLVPGERTAVCGMGGVGKSRLIMQLALCCRAGRDFLGWTTQGRDLRWLFLQTENTCRRLKFDLERMLTEFTPEECAAIKKGVFFHTLESDDDGFLMLDAQNSERISAAIETNRADIVVLDPLRDFAFDDLNADRHMAEVLRELSRIVRRGNPKRVPLVIHHAGTGKAGMQKATGFDRSSFGRNSKVLFLWARAQINVVPARPDDNNLIIIASGKCSNAPEFEPFAARLDEPTMLYNRDESVDVDEWRQRLESPRGNGDKLTLETLLDQLPPSGSILKATVIEHLKDKGIGEKRARTFINENVTPSGPVHEWHIKRSGRRDEIHLARHAQSGSER